MDILTGALSSDVTRVAVKEQLCKSCQGLLGKSCQGLPRGAVKPSVRSAWENSHFFLDHYPFKPMFTSLEVLAQGYVGLIGSLAFRSGSQQALRDEVHVGRREVKAKSMKASDYLVPGFQKREIAPRG